MSTEGTSPSERAARGFKRGDPEDVQAVLRRVQHVVSFRGFGIPEDDRKDITQEAMIHIWQATARSNFNPCEGFWGFVEVVAARRCIDWYRKARTHSELDDNVEDTKQSPLSRVLAREKTDQARMILAELGKACRELIRLRIARELSFAEISHELGRSPGALRVQFYRCIRHAQERISRPHSDRNCLPDEEQTS